MSSFVFPRYALIAIGLLFITIAGCDDAQEKIRFDKRSEFERILVVDKGGERYLRFGKADSGNQSTISLSDPDTIPTEYIRFAMLGVLMTPGPERVLMIGLGGGTFTSLLRRHYPDLWIDVAEIDPVVVEAAREFFGVHEDERLRIHVADGAKFIRDAEQVYDLVLLDAYSGEGIAEDLTSTTFFDAVKARLSNSGVAMLNLWSQGARERLIADVFAEASQIRPVSEAKMGITWSSSEGLLKCPAKTN